METINKNTKIVAKYLSEQKQIKRVFYPCIKDSPNYLLRKKYLIGCSGLISFIFKNSNEHTAQLFYDNIGKPVLKGPSLGSENTLLSPYVLMAHYDDSQEELNGLNLDFYLMRLSVGTEPIEEIINSLRVALQAIQSKKN